MKETNAVDPYNKWHLALFCRSDLYSLFQDLSLIHGIDPRSTLITILQSELRSMPMEDRVAAMHYIVTSNVPPALTLSEKAAILSS